MKKFLTLSLALLLTVFPLTACKGEPVGNAGDSTSAAVGDGTTTADVSPQDSIPIQNYSGADYNILVADEFFTHRDIIVESANGEALNDAMYNRYRTIEEKYGVKINLLWQGGGCAETAKILERSVKADDIKYDLVAIHASSIAEAIAKGLFMDLSKFEYPNFENPWWNQSMVKSMSIKDVLLIVPSATELSYSSAIFFNKQMAVDYELGDIYQMVRDGKWTVDNFAAICKKVSRDVDGNGTWDINDQYGLTTQNSWMLKSYMYAGNHTVLTKAENDTPVLNKDYARLQSIIEKNMELMRKDAHLAYLYEANIDNRLPISMESGRVFAIGMHIGEAHMLRNSEVDYGIVPLPKLDESQKNYTGIAWTNFWGVPVNVTDPVKSGLIFEALSAESYYSIMPIFKENLLNIKYTRDEQSIEMLDLIYDNMIYDMAPNYDTLNPYTNIIYELLNASSSSVTSYMEKNEPVLQAELDKIIGAYDSYKA